MTIGACISIIISSAKPSLFSTTMKKNAGDSKGKIKLSDYERIRATNIEKNNARLRALGLISANEEEASNAIAWRQSTGKSPEKKVKTKRKREESSPGSRKSLRLQGKQPNGVELPPEKDLNSNDDEVQKEREARILECRKVRMQRAVEIAETGAEKAARENPTATYEHCLMRVRSMTHNGLKNRVRAIERAAGKHSVIKMAIFKSCLQDEGLWELADVASQALERLKALKVPIEDE